MPLIVLETRRGPASSASNSFFLPEVCPDREKSRFFPVIEPVLERYFASFLMNYHQAQPNLRSRPLFFPYLTTIENP